ncbi:hypothetical protein J6590_019441 [Homalodisca vitripennis]|nr:hypothetical protein J6590_019441 [Homalodisca vitripennis]
MPTGPDEMIDSTTSLVQVVSPKKAIASQFDRFVTLQQALVKKQQRSAERCADPGLGNQIPGWQAELRHCRHVGPNSLTDVKLAIDSIHKKNEYRELVPK